MKKFKHEKRKNPSIKFYILCFMIFTEQVIRQSSQRFRQKWKRVMLTKLNGCCYFNILKLLMKKDLRLLNTIHLVS